MNLSFVKPNDSLNIERYLYLKVIEARKLPIMDLTGSSDPYCKIEVEAVKQRTNTIWRNLNPFFGEEYYFEIFNENGIIQVSVFDEDTVTRDDFIGKIDIPINSLFDQQAHEQWYPLYPQNTHIKISGEILVSLCYTPPTLKIKIFEGKNLAAKDHGGASDPYIKIYLGKEKKKTCVVHKTVDPVWNEEFEYHVSESSGPHLQIMVWNYDRIISNDFLGQVIIPLSELEVGVEYKQWYILCPIQKRKIKYLGDLRMRLKYSEIYVFPAEVYTDLKSLILDDQQYRIVTALGKTTNEKEEVARNLVRLFESHTKCFDLLKYITDSEINTTVDANVIFRGNSISTKSLDQYMKLVGMQYLHSTLKPAVDEIFATKSSCEIDVQRDEKLKNDERAKNLHTLRGLIERITSAILNSASRCPKQLRVVFNSLQVEVVKKYPSDPRTRYTVVAGFIFLRFFCAAILTPKLFFLSQIHPDQTISRTLTLISKALQNLANLVEFGYKEDYMKDLNPWLTSNFDALKSFIDTISNPENSFPAHLNHINPNQEFATLHKHLESSFENLKDNYKAEPWVNTLHQTLQPISDKIKAIQEKSDKGKVKNFINNVH